MKRLSTICLVAVVLVVLAGNGFGGTYSGGSGDSNDPYQIGSAEDIIEMSETSDDWDDCFLMIADVNMVGYTFTKAVIAPDEDAAWGFQGTYFNGVFDGADHKVFNLTIDTAGADNEYLGLFGKIYVGGEVRNLGMQNVSIIGGDNSKGLGGLCGRNGDILDPGGTINNCYSEGVVSGYRVLGGLCGGNRQGTISNSYATGSVIGGDNSSTLGGLCGHNEGTITNCYANSAVNGGSSVGGLCGINASTITNCYSEGSVTGEDGSLNLGGLCGIKRINGTINNCYATGSVTGGAGSANLGGLCGKVTGIVYHCFWDVETSGITSSIGGIGKTTIEMMDIDTYAGWGDNIWTIDNGNDYPHLIWENQPGVPIVDNPRTYSGGTGLVEEPYLIAEPNDLFELEIYSADWNKHFKLSNDIDMSAFVFDTRLIPIFSGAFDGADHKILNLTIDTDGVDNCYLGLFGKIDACGEIKKLGMENVSIIGGDESWYLGGLCGRNSGTISDCYSDGSISNVSRYLGGLCGLNEGTISNSYNTGLVTAGVNSNSVGGLCGHNSGKISNSYNTGSITAGVDSESIGGLCGYNGYNGSINSCSTTGTIDGYEYLGGLCGTNKGTIFNSYSESLVNGNNYLGGLCGSTGGAISNCYSIGSVNGGDNSSELGGLCGAIGGTVIDCYTVGSVSGGTESRLLGGLCGGSDGTISDCYSNCSITAGTNSDEIGGLCGKNTNIINNCFASGSVNAGDGSEDIGGLCGINFDTIKNCYSTVSVSGTGSDVGGLVGGNYPNPGIIDSCYSTGSVSGITNVGGLCGYYSGGTFGNCFWDSDTSDTTDGVGNVEPDPSGVTGLPTEDMQKLLTFTDAGWDFINIWDIGENQTYPYLRIVPGSDINKDGITNLLDYVVLAGHWLEE